MSVTFSRACTTSDFTECAALSLMVRYVSVVCSGVHRPPEGQGEMVLRGHNRGFLWFHSVRGIMIHGFIKILCHVGFSISQAV